ncbi:MAG: ABC transporter ATP-binding protein [bacterium]|nr:ABC transporter ATP-binding protein [bacterium]
MSVVLKADRVRVEFGALVAVRDVSFEMAGGDLLGLIGPNGAGKTTLLRALVGLQEMTSGSAEILGHDVFQDSDPVRGQVGFAPDAPPAYEELTVEEFLRFIADTHNIDGSEADERIDFWLEQVWLVEKRGERIKNLSRGMRQRITIAQTLLPSPAVVLLDEPSAGLDPAGRIQLRQVIASLRDQGKAVIVSSHILADLEEYCTHIAIIEQGHLLRYAHVGDLGDEDASRCGYRLTVAADNDVSEAIMALEGVAHLVRENHTYVFEYAKGERESAGLLRMLVERGVPVSSFASTRDSLEDVYLKTGVRQVD